MKDLSPVFSPRSIAVVGASSRPLSVGWETMNSILKFNFTGAVYPVNPKSQAISGIKTYPSLIDIPDEVDLAVIVVKRDLVLPTMEQCAQKGVRGAIVVTAGFKEVDEEGTELESRITAIARENGIVTIGPNCMGAFNTDPKIFLNATFARYLPRRGPIGFVSQSGAMGAAVLDYAAERHLGFSRFISIGNKADIDENDVLEWFEQEDDVSVVVLYLENFVNPRRFMDICSRLSRRKPVVVLKSGRTEAGARAATSHTGALAGSDTAVDALLRRSGALRVDSVDELLTVSHFFSMPRRPKGTRLGLITNAGGPGIIATDELEKAGFTFNKLENATVNKLKDKLPPEASCANPCDVLPGTGVEGYRVATEALMNDSNLDALVILFLCPVMVKTSWLVDAIKPVVAASPIPVIGLFMGASDVTKDAESLEAVGMPIFNTAPEVAQSLLASRRYDDWLKHEQLPPAEFDIDHKKADSILKRAQEGWLTGQSAFSLLGCYGIPVVNMRMVKPDENIIDAAAEMKYPLAMKIVSPEIIHKSDVGGVELGIINPEDLSYRYSEMMKRVQWFQPDAKIEGVLLQEMVSRQMEMIIGMSREPGFGPLVMCGMGGIFVEVLKDVAFSLAPMPADEPLVMIQRLRSAPVLEGIRGTMGADKKQVAEVIARVSQLATDYPDIEQIDINPLLVGPDGCVAVDARIKLS